MRNKNNETAVQSFKSAHSQFRGGVHGCFEQLTGLIFATEDRYATWSIKFEISGLSAEAVRQVDKSNI